MNRNKKGQSLIEYLILLAVVALGIGVISIRVRNNFDSYFDRIANRLIDSK